MLTVIGKIGCTRCVQLKNELIGQGVDFQYFLYEEMSVPAKRVYAKIIRDENDGHFPLVIDEKGNVREMIK